MSRPKPPPHAIEPFLKGQSLRAGTIRTYTAIIRRIDASKLTPTDWLDRELTPATPKRTLAVLRTAVAYLQEWQDGTTRSVANAALPKTRAQPSGPKVRDALDAEQLSAYLAAAEQEDEPYRTILKLLPRTGLRIAELCGLATSEADYKANAARGAVLGGWFDRGTKELQISGKKGVARAVPMSAVALNILTAYLTREAPPAPWMFWRNRDRPELEPHRIDTRDVQRVTIRIAQGNPDVLAHLSPHILRHTAATGMLNAGVDLPTIQVILGHQSLQSLDPYLHADRSKRRAAVETIG